METGKSPDVHLQARGVAFSEFLLSIDRKQTCIETTYECQALPPTRYQA
jgi:hypothetical protein